MKLLYDFLGVIALCAVLLLSGCEFQTKDSEVEKLRIANERAAEELRAAAIKHQAESFERIITDQNKTITAAVSAVSGRGQKDLVPYLMMILCLGIAIGILILCAFLMSRNHERRPEPEPKIFVLNPESGELRLINQLLIGHQEGGSWKF